jgi:ribosomal protein S18 acetylase RimI-like enzyme
MIRYQESLDGVTADHLVGFWEGWPARPTPEAHLGILAGSERIVLAIDPEASGRVVGFVTAVGDGTLASYIPLLEVLPEYRGRGIGSELVRRMLGLLRDRYMVDLVCDQELVPFYERFGMARCGAMILRRREVAAAMSAGSVAR